MRKGYRKMTQANIKAISAGMKQYAELEKMFNLPQIQSNRFLRDCLVGAAVGVSDMNTDLHGWDGEFADGTPFENKNVSSKAKTGHSLTLEFKDTSNEKLTELVEGVLATHTAWVNSGEVAFLMVGNTKNIGKRLVEAYRPYGRRVTTASMSHCLANGFKLVAINYTKQQVIDAVTEKFPRLGKSLTPADIYTKKELKSLVASMI